MTDEPKEIQTIEVEGKVVFDETSSDLLMVRIGYHEYSDRTSWKQYRVIVVEVE